MLLKARLQACDNVVCSGRIYSGGARVSSCKRRCALPGAAVERQDSGRHCVARRRRKCLAGVERRSGGCRLQRGGGGNINHRRQ